MTQFSQLSGARVLVTGASGFIGRHVAGLGVSIGAEIHSVSCDQQCVPGIRNWNVDITDPGQLKEAVDAIRPAAVLHLAAAGVAYGTSSTYDLLRVNTCGLAGLLECLSRSGLTIPVVIAGSGFEYQPQDRPLREEDVVAPQSGYGVSKAAATLLAGVYASRMPITVLRFFSIYGPGEREPRLLPYIVAQAKKSAPVELTACEQIRDYTYVGDVAESFWRTLCKPSESGKLRLLNMASGTSVTLRQFVEKVAEELGARGLCPNIHFGAKPYRPDEPMHYVANVERARDVLGWVPQTPLAQGIRQTVETLV